MPEFDLMNKEPIETADQAIEIVMKQKHQAMDDLVHYNFYSLISSFYWLFVH